MTLSTPFAAGTPELNIAWVSSIQLLPNGSLLAGNFLLGREAKPRSAFVVARDKAI